MTNIISGIERKEFLTEAVILQSSPLIGKKLVETSIPSLTGFRLLDVVRNGKSTAHAQENLVLQAKDKLVLSCKPHGIIEAREIEGMDLFNDSKLGIEQVSSETGIMVEAVVGPSSSLISKSLSDAHFRSRYNLTILAIHRKGKNVSARCIRTFADKLHKAYRGLQVHRMEYPCSYFRNASYGHYYAEDGSIRSYCFFGG